MRVHFIQLGVFRTHSRSAHSDRHKTSDVVIVHLELGVVVAARLARVVDSSWPHDVICGCDASSDVIHSEPVRASFTMMIGLVWTGAAGSALVDGAPQRRGLPTKL